MYETIINSTDYARADERIKVIGDVLEIIDRKVWTNWMNDSWRGYNRALEEIRTEVLALGGKE